jgi:DNA-binding NarL/FixJ family response regulator
MSINPISIIIADAHVIPRNGLAKTLEDSKELHVAATTGDCAELVSLCNHHQPDIIMISAAMPGINNTKSYRHISAEFPGTGIIIMADNNDAETIIALKSAGEFAWLCKSATEEKIAATIQAVHEGKYKKELYNGYVANAVNRALLQTLSPREKEMLTFFGADLTAKEIAAKVNVSRRTIEGHKEKLKEKLQVKGSAGLAIYALIHNTYLPTLLYWVMMLLSTDTPDILLPDLPA